MKLTVFWFVNSSDKWTRLIFIVIWSLSNANKMSIACYHSSKRRSMRWVRKTEPFVTDFTIPLQKKKNHSLVLSFSSLFLYFFIFFLQWWLPSPLPPKKYESPCARIDCSTTMLMRTQNRENRERSIEWKWKNSKS